MLKNFTLEEPRRMSRRYEGNTESLEIWPEFQRAAHTAKTSKQTGNEWTEHRCRVKWFGRLNGLTRATANARWGRTRNDTLTLLGKRAFALYAAIQSGSSLDQRADPLGVVRVTDQSSRRAEPAGCLGEEEDGRCVPVVGAPFSRGRCHRVRKGSNGTMISRSRSLIR